MLDYYTYILKLLQLGYLYSYNKQGSIYILHNRQKSYCSTLARKLMQVSNFSRLDSVKNSEGYLGQNGWIEGPG